MEHYEEEVADAIEETLDQLLSNEGHIKADIKVSIDNEGLSDLLNREIESRLNRRIVQKVEQAVERRLDLVIKNAFNDNVSAYVQERIKDVIHERFDKAYPLATEKKVDKLDKTTLAIGMSVCNVTILEKSLAAGIGSDVTAAISSPFWFFAIIRTVPPAADVTLAVIS